MSGPKVFVIGWSPNRDFSDARRYGTIVPVFKGELKIEGGRIADEEIKRAIDMMAGFNPDQDLLLLSGDPLAIVLVMAALDARWVYMSLLGHRLRFLKWDRDKQAYEMVRMERW